MKLFPLAIGCALACCAFFPRAAVAEKPFEIDVVDAATGRGVPLVELETMDNRLYVTDSAGRVAFDEAGQMGVPVWFSMRSHGYEFPTDGFGMTGMRFTPRLGEKAVVKAKRLNIAERVVRLTGQGIYRDTVLLGEKPPLAEPLTNGGVVGQDSVQTAIYKGRIFWLWGDTMRMAYPLGNFRTACAWSELPSKGGLPPSKGADLHYYVGKDGFAKEMCPLEKEEGVVWLFGLCVRVPARLEDVLDPASYEAWTCAGKLVPRRKPNGALDFAWRKDAPPIESQEEAKWLKLGVIKPEECRVLPEDATTKERVALHEGSVCWNEHRKRWVLIAVQQFGKPSFLGEVWYAESAAPTGPWKRAVKILTHDKYSFYNPSQHAFFDEDGGRTIYFEGTYSHTFSGRELRTPQYDYNQILYRLDLADPRLKDVQE